MPPVSTEQEKTNSLETFSLTNIYSKSTGKNVRERAIHYLDGNEDIIYTLAYLSSYSFQYYSDGSNVKLRESEVHLLLGTFSKLQKCPFVESLRHIVLIISANGFIDTINAYLLILTNETVFSSEYNWNIFFTNLLNFFKCLTNFDYNSCSKFRSLHKKVEQSLFLTKSLLSELVKHKHLICLPSLLDESDKLLNMCSFPEKIKDKNDINNDVWNLFPTTSEMLRADLTKFCFNPYLNIENYFKHQFILLKEDYLGVIRDGLNQYKDEINLVSKKARNFNIFVYKTVKFTDYTLDPTSPKTIGYKLSLDDGTHLSGARSKKSKRFLFGSLLIFSQDNFDSFFIGLVRDRSGLEFGENVIEVTLVESAPPDLIGSSFTMIEPTVYFEPYHQVLNCLKTLSTLNYSMGSYLISKEISVAKPRYLSSSAIYDIFGYNVSVCHMKTWPSASSLNLDRYQLDALKSALNDQFALIQGPPGTGKTYLGLKIVEILLQNQKIWNKPISPILVICYTNHALDQFLEGVIPMTNKIVRIGGQSRSNTLESYNLKVLWKKPYPKLESLLNLRTNIKHLIASSIKSISCYKKGSELISKNLGILHYDLLNSVMSPEHKAVLYCEDTFLNWLLDNSTNYHPILHDENDESNSNSTFTDILYIEPEYDEYEKQIKNVDAVLKYQLSLYELETKLIFLSDQIKSKKVTDLKPVEILSLVSNIYNFISQLNIFKFLKKKLSSAREQSSMSAEDLHKVNLKTMNLSEKWCLYFLWQDEVRHNMVSKFQDAITEHSDICKFFKEAGDIESYVNIKQFGTQVIGVTTTGAARYNRLLSLLKPKIVIVEEAAEILEAHTVTSLTRNCQHVIMIGDHFQLRPSNASYELTKGFKLDVSLFERLIKGGLPVHTLRTQRRMRPVISSLVTPLIYKQLDNHTSVYDYPDIKGTRKNLYFINHNIFENDVPDSHSHKNIYEADFLLSLCIYFMKQGYDPSEITILTTYLAQENYMIQKRNSNTSLKNVRITVVDNYQGEENNIILLSLVRSNQGNHIGYLTSRNRMCVALTRAKHGLFIVGNMDCLMQASDLWKKLHSTLVKNDSYGDNLELVCQTHENITLFSLTSDLNKIKKGGCGNVCDYPLLCGHKCSKVCHGVNIDHETLQCREKCNRLCSIGHQCKLFCFEDCGQCIECEKLNKPDKTVNEEISVTESNQPSLSNFTTLVSNDEYISGTESDSDLDLNFESMLGEDFNVRRELNTGDIDLNLHDDLKNEDVDEDINKLTCGESVSDGSLGNNDNILQENRAITDETTKENKDNCKKLFKCLENKGKIQENTVTNDYKIKENDDFNKVLMSLVNMDKNTQQISLTTDGNNEGVKDDKMNNIKELIESQVKLLTTVQNVSPVIANFGLKINDSMKINSTNTYEDLISSSFEISDSFYSKKADEKYFDEKNGDSLNGLYDESGAIGDETSSLSVLSINSNEKDEISSAHCGVTNYALNYINETKSFQEDIVTYENSREASSTLAKSLQENNAIDETRIEASSTITKRLQEDNVIDETRIEASSFITKCKRVLPCSHLCPRKCNTNNCQTVKCEEMVSVRLACNHINNVKCYLSYKCTEVKVVGESLLEWCKEACGQQLECGHICQGTCSGCAQGRIHQKCSRICNKALICGHKCKSLCWDDVHSCEEACNKKCIHQKCTLRCKEECKTCQEKCDWSCEHFKCTARCGEPCNRPPCMFGCQNLLACSHPCTGFCGEPCPPICLLCQPSDQYDPSIHRFVLLEECGHYFEWSDLLKSLSLGEISLKQCPKCKVTIWRTMRLKQMILTNNNRAHLILNSNNPEYLHSARIKCKILQTFALLKEYMTDEVLCNGNFQLLLQYTIDNMGLILLDLGNNRSNTLKSLLFIQVFLLEISKFISSNDLFSLRGYHRQLLFLRINVFLKQLYTRKEVNYSEFIHFELESLKIHRTAEFFALYEDYFKKIKNTRKDSDVIKELCFKAFNYINSLTSYNLKSDIKFVDIICRFKESIGSTQKHSVDTNMFKNVLRNSLLPIFKKKHYHQGDWLLCPKGHLFQLNSFYNNQCDTCL